MTSIAFASDDMMIRVDTIRHCDIEFYFRSGFITKAEEIVLRSLKGSMTIESLKNIVPMPEFNLRMCLKSLEKKKLVKMTDI